MHQGEYDVERPVVSSIGLLQNVWNWMNISHSLRMIFFLSPREKVFLFILLALLDPLTSLGQLILKFFDAKNGVSETTFSRATLLPKFELCEGPNWTCSAHFCLCNAVSAS